MQPSYVIFAGINGAGKTTLFKSGMWETQLTPRLLRRVNPDEILKTEGLDPADARDQLVAGKIAVRQIREHFENSESFTHETVFAARASLARIGEGRRHGFRVVLNYVGLESSSLAIERIAHRVETGGHDIAAALVEKRWGMSLRNLSRAIGICDEVHVFDNTEYLEEIAAWDSGTLCWWGVGQLRGRWLADALGEAG